MPLPPALSPEQRAAALEKAAAARLNERRGAADQKRERSDVLPQYLVKRRNLRTLLRDKRLLLGDF